MNQDLYCSSRQDHGLDKALDQQLIVMCREALDSGTPVRFSTTIANTNRTVGTMLGHELDQSLWRPRSSRRHHRHHVRRIGGQQLRRVRAEGHHPAGVRRRQRLCRQGPLRRPAGGASVGRRTRGLRRRGQHHRGQRDPVRRDQRPGVPARRRRRAVRGAQLGRPRGGGRRRRPRLRVHDRRQGRHPRPHRPQLRGRHVRRRRLRLRRRRHVRRRTSTPRWWTSTRWTTRTSTSCAA